MPFSKCLARLSIASLDEAGLTVTAQYNPNELGINKSVPWGSKQSEADPKAMTRSEQDSHEFKGTPSRSMQLELLFDGYETDHSVEPIVEMLETLTTVRDPESTNPEMRRPHYCVVVFGDGIKPLRVVITSLSVKYTMFGHDGTPLRAVCTLMLEEARIKSSFGAVRSAGFDAVKAIGRAALEMADAMRGVTS